MSLSVTQHLPQRESKTHIDSLSNSPHLYSDTDSCHQSSPETTHTPTMMSTLPQPTTDGAPALPVKSSLRASRLLDDIVLSKVAVEDQPLSAHSVHHELYLSSEEEVSSSAADFSDFDLDSDVEEPQKSAIRRGSHEDTARMVSVVFSGKPSVIDLPRRASSPSCSASETSSRPASRMSSRPPSSRLRRTSTIPLEMQNRASICSSASVPVLHPPRTSSIGPGRLEKMKPQFLSIDPFAINTEAEAREKEQEQTDNLKTPKTPTGVFKRTLSLVRKRSRPSLNTSYAAQSRDNLSLFTPTSMEQVQEDSPLDPQPRPPTASTPVLTKAPTYHEIMKNAKRRSSTAPLTPISPMSQEPASPMTPNSTRSRLRQGLAAAARRRSSIRT